MIMTFYFDTHVHFGNEKGDYSTAAQIERALAAGVTHMIAVGGSCELNKAAAEAAEAYPESIRAAIGFDRAQVREISTPVLIDDATDRLRRSLDSLKSLGVDVCAIGEVGLDYHYTPETAGLQMALLEAQCDLAAELRLPVIVHCREAETDVLRILETYARHSALSVHGVLHCFTGSLDFAERLIAAGFMISFSGIVTFQSADALRDVAVRLPAEHLLIETDSPYLAPVPHRGKRNEPAFVKDVGIALAGLRECDADELAETTSDNAQRLFGKWASIQSRI